MHGLSNDRRILRRLDMRVKRTTAWHQPRDETVPPTYQCNVALLEEKVISRSVCVILGDYQPRWYWFAPVSLSMSRQKRIPRSPPPQRTKLEASKSRIFQIWKFPTSNFVCKGWGATQKFLDLENAEIWSWPGRLVLHLP